MYSKSTQLAWSGSKQNLKWLVLFFTEAILSYCELWDQIGNVIICCFCMTFVFEDH